MAPTSVVGWSTFQLAQWSTFRLSFTLGSLRRSAEVGPVEASGCWQEQAVLAATERDALREEVFRLKAEREGRRTR